MQPELVIITPELAPGLGGLADHTRRLLQEWPRIQNLTLLVANSTGLTDDSIGEIHTLGVRSDAILRQLPTGNAKVFVQYSAYGFDRIGYPRELIRALITWKGRTGGGLVVMFHEIWAFCSVLNKNFVVQQLHRRALRNLLRCCDAAFTTTESQAEHLTRLAPEKKVQVLPVGSNIRLESSRTHARQRGCAIVFGLQSSRIRALRQLSKSLTALAAARRITKIVSAGHGSNPEMTNEERELLGALNLADGFEQRGPMTEAAISELLGSSEIGIFGQSELSCTKSGSFMAYASHELIVLADFASPSKPPPICWTASPGELLAGISEADLRQRAKCLRIWQEQNGSWQIIADTIGRALDIQTSVVETAKHPGST
jgi:hypothetical protein